MTKIKGVKSCSVVKDFTPFYISVRTADEEKIIALEVILKFFCVPLLQ